MTIPLRRQLAAALLAFTVALTACSAQAEAAVPSATSAPLPDAALQAVLDQTRAAAGFPGVVARVVRGDRVWTGASGATEAGGATLPTARDHTRIGSVTKTMTATVLLQLVQEGRLTLEDPLSRYIDGIPNGSATLRQVADMTSGIPTYTASSAFTSVYFADPEKVWTAGEIVAIIRSLAPPFAVGDGWEYSNSNYYLLGLVIEKVTGQTLADAFQERLFGPLGMTQTSFPAGGVLPEPFLSGVTAQGSQTTPPRDATHFSPSMAGGAGEVVSTLDDLQRWAHALFTGDGVLDPATQQLRRDSILTAPAPNTATAGYGIGIGDRNGWWGHDGQIPGYTTSVFHDYATDTTVLVVVNSDVTVGDTGKAPAPTVTQALQGALG